MRLTILLLVCLLGCGGNYAEHGGPKTPVEEMPKVWIEYMSHLSYDGNRSKPDEYLKAGYRPAIILGHDRSYLVLYAPDVALTVTEQKAEK